jgi:Diacylglycerol kinase accessory domain
LHLPSLHIALILELASCIFHRDLRSGHDQMPRIDSVEDLSQVLTDDHQRLQHVTACEMPSSCQDGILDIVSVRGAFHLGQIRVGLSSAQRLCQCREATIYIKRKVAVQIDGEPWRQNICTLRVKRKPDRAIMLHKSEDKNGVETEVANLLDWAEKRELIDGNVHYAMMKEFSRRIEHKTRQRRHNESNNLFSLKRAIGSTGAIASSYDGSYNYSS